MPRAATVGPAAVSDSVLWTRATVITLAVVGTAAVAHSAAAGLLPGAVPLTALTAVAVVVVRLTLGHGQAKLRVLAVVVTGQAAVHAAFTAVAGHLTDVPGGVAAMPTPTSATAAAGIDAATGRHVEPGTLADALGMQELLTRAAQAGDGRPTTTGHVIAHLVDPSHLPMAAAHAAAAGLLACWFLLCQNRIVALVMVLAADLGRVRTLVGRLLATGRAVMAAALQRLRGRVRAIIRRPRRTATVASVHLQSPLIVWRGPPALG
ncbi:MAG: hypothetical protein EPO13_12050 [Actinomycetota bacterium]|nr:MAG: hypothetical protein EPO13_12050 [Actinomycetota bacterium]